MTNGTKKKNQILTHIKHLSSDSITLGANLGFVENFYNNIFTLIEDIVSSEEGVLPKVSSLRIFFQASSKSKFTIGNVWVQTAGTLSDSPNLSQRTVHKMLDAACDDQLGFDQCSPFEFAKFVRLDRGDQDPDHRFGIQRYITANQKILNLINRAVGTERLQELYLAAFGIGSLNAQIIYIDIFVEIKYTEYRKQIIIR